MKTFTEENYLKTLFMLSDKNGGVNSKELSSALGIKMPTVNSMMKKLAEKKLVIYESYKPIKLTKKGKKEAALILRKHRLTEMFLVEKMDFGWGEVHNIAEQIEHIQSEKLFEKMDELLGHPKFDPHGEPIPDRKGCIQNLHNVKLSECKIGEKVQLVGLDGSPDDLIRFLNNRKIKLNDEFVIENIEKFDGSVVVKLKDGISKTLTKTVCNKLLVSSNK